MSSRSLDTLMLPSETRQAMAAAKSSPDVKLAEALEVLREHGFRLTKPRTAVLEILTREHGPFSAEDLHDRLGEKMCDLVTVYRCLASLEEINLVRRCDFGDGSYRYEFNTGEDHHHHVICRVCKSVETVHLCVADSLERLVRQMGYSNVSHTLELFGVCAKCQKVPAAKTGNAASEKIASARK